MRSEEWQYITRYVTWDRFWNTLKAFLSEQYSRMKKTAVVWANPVIVMIEPTNACNLKCPLCPSGLGILTREKGFMDVELYKRLIDEISPWCASITLWNQGEPFLHPRFLEMVQYAHNKRIHTLTSTNANIIWDGEEVVRSGLDRIIISIDGITQETYNKYRVNGELSKVIENTRNLVQAKRKLNSPTPAIYWQFLVLRHNEHQIQEAERLAKDIGVDKFMLKTAQIYNADEIDTYLPANRKFNRYKRVGDGFALKYDIGNRCQRLWIRSVVNWNGIVSVCCFDKDIDFPVGDFKQASLASIWRDKPLMRFRNLMMRDRKSVPMCLNCAEGVRFKDEKIRV